MDITKEEQSAIQKLKRVAKTWPKTLWLFSGNGELCVMKKTSINTRSMRRLGTSDAYNPDYLVESIDIENDGGDW